MRLYLAGPMTGLPQFNYPAFASWAKALRYHGFEVISPHEEDNATMQAEALASLVGDPTVLSETPEETALRNVRGIAESDGLALIPGWHSSSGAVHEIATATRFKLPVAPVQLWLAATGAYAAESLSLTDPAAFLNEESLL